MFGYQQVILLNAKKTFPEALGNIEIDSDKIQ